MKVKIIDDDDLQIQLLNGMLTLHPDIDEITKNHDAVKGIQNIKEEKPDLVFLDINMPKMSGIEAAQEINKLDTKPVIIFTTSFENYAVHAFNLNAGDYLVKPYSKERLFQSIDKARIRMNQRTNRGSEVNKIAVQEADAIILLDLKDIYYVEALGRKTLILTKSKKYATKETLAALEKRLNKDFIRCHKSYLVNYKKINRIEPMFNRTYMIKYEDVPYKVPVSRKYGRQVLEVLGV